MTPHEEIADAIIKKFILVLGQEEALARTQTIKGLVVTKDGKTRIVGRSPKEGLEELINSYRAVLGPAALVFCREASEAVLKHHPFTDVPEAIKPVIRA